VPNLNWFLDYGKDTINFEVGEGKGEPILTTPYRPWRWLWQREHKGVAHSLQHERTSSLEKKTGVETTMAPS
jgi:hypothetical protein